jgi:hypothetical protein
MDLSLKLIEKIINEDDTDKSISCPLCGDKNHDEHDKDAKECELCGEYIYGMFEVKNIIHILMSEGESSKKTILKQENIKNIILDNYDIFSSRLQCPDCFYFSGNDDQYTCTTCWGEGGAGTFSGLEIIKYLYGKSP